MDIKTRFAPSPTGYLHIGGARTALFSWLYARHHQGKFVLRIEDTDRERSTQESVDAILRGMEWLGMDYDEGPYYQTERFDRYQQVIEQLLDEGKAYRCYCTREELDALRTEQQKNKQKPRYDGRYRDHKGPVPSGIDPVIRFKNPLAGDVVIDDQVLGQIVINNCELDDLIIARSDGTPTYNLTVVVDDMDMAISHVIRGDDHINNTPRQMNLLAAMGGQLPTYAHLPMILGADGKRMSKRHGAVSVSAYAEEGYLPAALMNYLVRLGWSHGDQEIFSMPEMIALFSLDSVNKSAAAFDLDKLQWLNQQYIKSAPDATIVDWLSQAFRQKGIAHPDKEKLTAVAAIQKDRYKTVHELTAHSEYFFVSGIDGYDQHSVRKHFNASTADLFSAMLEYFEQITDWTAANIQAAINHYMEHSGLKLGKVAPPLRIAITGSASSPSIDITLQLVGKAEVLTRIQQAIEYIQHASQ